MIGLVLCCAVVAAEPAARSEKRSPLKIVSASLLRDADGWPVLEIRIKALRDLKSYGIQALGFDKSGHRSNYSGAYTQHEFRGLAPLKAGKELTISQAIKENDIAAFQCRLLRVTLADGTEWRPKSPFLFDAQPKSEEKPVPTAEAENAPPLKLVSVTFLRGRDGERVLEFHAKALRDINGYRVQIMGYDNSGHRYKDALGTEQTCYVRDPDALKAGKERTISVSLPNENAPCVKCQLLWVILADGTEWRPKSPLLFEAKPKSEEKPIPAAASPVPKPAP
ncbi:MAG: hypothetical protein ACLP9L_14185 [Thermoguttaceae bacterium]